MGVAGHDDEKRRYLALGNPAVQDFIDSQPIPLVIVEALTMYQIEHRVILIWVFSITRRQVEPVIQRFGCVFNFELTSLNPPARL
jgi:hypothetical protein